MNREPVGILEARVLLSAVSFQLDAPASSLTLAATLASGSAMLVAQAPGSLVTSYAGTLKTDVSGSSLRLPGGSAATAQNSGNWQPGNTPANYGAQAALLGVSAFAAVRGLSFDLSAPAVTLGGGGSFPVGAMSLAITAGEIDLNLGSFGRFSETLVGQSGMDTAASSGTLTSDGTTETLTLPISATFPFSTVTSGDSQLQFTGVLVATAPAISIVVPPSVDLNGPASGTNYVTNFIPGGSAVPAADPAALTVTPGADATIASGAIVLQNPQDGSSERLAADTTGTSLSAAYDATSATLSITGAGSAADYQRVLRTVTYIDAAPAALTSTSPARTIVFTLHAAGDSAPATTTVLVGPPGQRPVVQVAGPNGQPPAVSFAAGMGPLGVFAPGALTVSDPNGTAIASASVTLSGGTDGTAEVLAVDTSGTSLAAAYDSGNAVLTLIGDAPADDYRRVLQTLTYDDASLTPAAGARSLMISVSDVAAQSLPALATVVDSGIAIVLADAGPRGVAFTDGSGVRVTAQFAGPGDATVSLGGSALSLTTGAPVVHAGGSGLSLTSIRFSGTTLGTRLRVSTRGGVATVGSIVGNLPVGRLDAPRLDLASPGLVMTDAGYIADLHLHDVAPGAGILMPGASSVSGISIDLDLAAPGDDITLGSPLRHFHTIRRSPGINISAPSY